MTITFLEGSQHEVKANTVDGSSILDVSLGSKLPHVNDCGGLGRCSTCRIRVVDGLPHLSPRTAEELEIATTYGWPEDIRLACQAIANGDVCVERLVHYDERRLDLDDSAIRRRSEELPLAVLFCDINGFTDFAAGCMPYDIVHILNQLFLRTGEAVLANLGYIDKYLGDGMLALWGITGGTARENCLGAIRAALLMQRAAHAIAPQTTSHFGRGLSLRIGIHFGPAIVGRIGHPARQHLTAVGDTVNIASRVEAANKELHTNLLISEECYAQLDDDVIVGDDFKVRLRGQNRPQRLYEITDLSRPDAAFIVQSQVTQLAGSSAEFVQRFYNHLLVSGEVSQLFAHVIMPQQHQRFFGQLVAVIRDIRNLSRFQEQLVTLGMKHRSYGAKPEHFVLAKTALLRALAETLGEEFDETAWSEVLDSIASAALRGLGINHSMGDPTLAVQTSSDGAPESRQE